MAGNRGSEPQTCLASVADAPIVLKKAAVAGAPRR